jgi:hypothetical protein
MSLQVQMGPPGTLGAGPLGIGGASPEPPREGQLHWGVEICAILLDSLF